MTQFEVKILGRGSALPTTRSNPSAQLINVNEKMFLIDCGEGTQLQLRRFRTKMCRLHSIFISHLHGDHIFGLPGLISTMSLLGRTADINLYAHSDIEPWLQSTMSLYCANLSFNVNLIPISPDGLNTIYETKSIIVKSFPLKHRIPTCGFVIEEKERARHIIREMIDFYNVPIKEINGIKYGNNFVTPDGQVIENSILTRPPASPRRYAYCSDTAYTPEIIPYIQGVDLLYHEATFAETELARANVTFHSTATHAAQIAKAADVKKLVIGHFSSRYLHLDQLLDEAKRIFPNTYLAEEGKSFRL